MQLSEGKCLLELVHREPRDGSTSVVWEPITKNVFWPPTEVPKSESPFSGELIFIVGHVVETVRNMRERLSFGPPQKQAKNLPRVSELELLLLPAFPQSSKCTF